MNLWDEKLTLLREMLAVSRRQTELLKSDEDTDTAEPLLFAIEQRESLTAAVDALDARMSPADAGPAVKADIRAVLTEIMENDEKNRLLLEEALLKTGGDITRLRGARKQINAYGGEGPIESGMRFDTSQ